MNVQVEKIKVFISMPFTGKKYDDLYNERLSLKELVESYGFELTEQFIGYQFKQDFDSKDYNPAWVLWKDKNWLKQSDVVISDFTSYSIGTDFELVLSKEVFDKKVYAVVPNERRSHPWLRFYCDHFFDSVEDALRQIHIDFPNGPIIKPVDKRQYDAIAGEYRLIEETVAQKYIYDGALTDQLKKYDVGGKKVIVLHCGSGYRARMAKDLGAREVLWIDLSYQEIRIAENIETSHPKGIHYLVADVYLQDFAESIPERFIGNTDIVIGYFALDHAMNRKELDLICENISALLGQDGTFLGMMDSPNAHTQTSGKYGVVLSFDNKNKNWEEGKPRRVSIFQNQKEVTHFHNFLWSEKAIRESLLSAHLKDVQIHDATVSEAGMEKLGEDFWKEYQGCPDQIVIEARK